MSKFVLVGDAEHYLKAKAHALGSPVLVKAAEAFEKPCVIVGRET